jgi:hypothetical protein
MRFLIKAVFVLLVLCGIALVGYAMFWDLPAPEREIVIPVQPG